MPAPLIVLNGPSSSGKSTIISELQNLWPRPLYTSGIDACIAGWPESHIAAPGDDGSPAPSAPLRIVPDAGPAPSWIPEFGDEFHVVTRHAHEWWAAMNLAGLDVVIDHVILDSEIREQAHRTLTLAFWVGVTCDVDELVRRETARGDRHLGFASGSFAVVHQDMHYDLLVDTTSTPATVIANTIRDAVLSR